LLRTSLYNYPDDYNSKLSIITPIFLKERRQQAIRKGSWYRVLDKMERGIVNLTIRCVDQVRSFTLAKTILYILKKLNDAEKTKFIIQREKYGRYKAKQVVLIAIRFGNKMAENWLQDEGLSNWLTIQDMYKTCGVTLS
jgi:hypothetical protein